MRSDRSLYNRLTEFALDDKSAAFKFSNRLARENGWSLAFAEKAIDEYKKFVYLAAISTTPVTPSDVVDQVWHLHLTYSRSYWDEMCGAILRKPLHHGPTKGGASEDAKYRDLYAATLDAYAREFGAEPPVEFWPPAEARFESAAHQRWVNTRTHLVLSWRTLTRPASMAVGALMLGSASAAFAAASAKGQHDAVPAVMMLVGVALVALIALATRGRKGKGGNGGDGSPGIWGSGDSGHHGHGHSGGGHDGGGHGSACSGGGDGGGSGCSGGGCSGS